jgi:hypothetical protein
MPEELPGIVHMNINVGVTSDSSLSIKSTMWPTGGIDLRVDETTALGRLPDNGRLPVISPIVEANDQIRRIMNHAIDVPLPPIPGWVAQAQGGHILALRLDDLSKRADSAAALQQLDQVRRKVAMPEGFDRMINAQTKSSVAGQAEAGRIEADAKEKLKEYLAQAYDTLVSVALAGDELRLLTGVVYARKSTMEALERAKDVDRVKGLLQDIQTARDRHDARPENLARITERLTQGAIEIQKIVVSNDPRNWVHAEEMAARRNLWSTGVFGLYGLGLKVLDAQAASKDANEFNDRMSRYASDAEQIRKMRMQAFDEYLAERRKFEAMVK